MTTALVGDVVTGPVFAAEWITMIDTAAYQGSTGTITFNDWGYVGPDGVEQMAGQFTFDFGGTSDSYSSTQLVNDFVMRSYGDYSVVVTNGGGRSTAILRPCGGE